MSRWQYRLKVNGATGPILDTYPGEQWSKICIHILRFEWTEGSVIESEITSHKSKTYKASLSSYKRVAEFVNRLSFEGMGKIKVWTTWPGWEYSSFGKEIENVDSHH